MIQFSINVQKVNKLEGEWVNGKKRRKEETVRKVELEIDYTFVQNVANVFYEYLDIFKDLEKQK